MLAIPRPESEGRPGGFPGGLREVCAITASKSATPMKVVTKRLAFLLLLTSCAAQAASDVVGGVVRSDALRQYMQAVDLQKALQTERVNIILEAPAQGINPSLIAAHGGALRYRQERLHEISIPAGRLAALLRALPAGVLARFPFPVQAVAVTGQGVALSGAGDMQVLGTSGAGIKIGIIDTGFGSLSASQAAGELPANLTLVDYTGSGTGGDSHGTNVAEVVHDMAPDAEPVIARP